MGLRLTRSDGHTNARTHASVTTGCSRRVELGLCSSFSGRDNPRTRCPRPVHARKGNPARAQSRKGLVAPLAASGTLFLP
jgi:hypothetical protein